MNDIGKPLYWGLNKHVEAIIQMIRADEIQIALEMIEKVPAFYRENMPAELTEIKNTLYRQLYDQIEYANDDEEANCTREFGEAQATNGYMFPRAEIISKIVKEYNNAGRTPWIFDLGASHGNLPLLLLKNNFDFTYLGKGLNYRIVQKVKEWVGDKWAEKPEYETEYYQGNPDVLAVTEDLKPTILYCTEVLEHCMNPMDIVQSAYKVGVNFDQILLSVPIGCLGGGLPDWDTRRLGHVRGWTKQEFYDFANKHWPGYQWQLTIAPSMVLVGKR